jgi:HAD superfamily hydrolase (TIGR01509 family)
LSESSSLRPDLQVAKPISDTGFLCERLDAIIFDMDGVIIDSEERHVEAFLDVCEEIGLGRGHGPFFTSYIGRSDAEFWAAFSHHYRLTHSLEQLQALKREKVIECFRRDLPLYPGLQEMIHRLKKRYRLALASGSDREVVKAVLALGDLEDDFEAVVTSADVPCGKPQPDMFLRAAFLLGVKPSRCWVIEDSKPGVAAGLAAGMRVIAITNTHPAEELVDAPHVVGTCQEIEQLLLP